MKNLNIFILQLFVLTLLNITGLDAQCTTIDQSTANSGTGTMVNSTTAIGQSFTACRTGQITVITVKIAAISSMPSSTVLKVASGNNTSSNVIHSQNVMINNTGNLEITLSQPVAVTNGQVYAFSLGGSGDSFNINFSTSLGDTYADGTLFQNTTVLGTADLFFSIAFGASPPIAIATAAAIPSMSEWGVLIFGLLVLNLGVGLIYRVSEVGSIK